MAEQKLKAASANYHITSVNKEMGITPVLRRQGIHEDRISHGPPPPPPPPLPSIPSTTTRNVLRDRNVDQVRRISAVQMFAIF